MKKILAAATIMAGLPATAVAESDAGLYATIQPVGFGVEMGGSNTASHSGIGARIGYNLNKFFGVEGEVNYVYSSGEYSLSNNELSFYDDVDTEMNYNAGAFVVGKIPFNKSFEIFARAGYTTTDWESDSCSWCNYLESERFAAGLGLQTFFGSKKQHGLRVDLTGYEGDQEMAQFSLGYAFRK